MAASLLIAFVLIERRAHPAPRPRKPCRHIEPQPAGALTVTAGLGTWATKHKLDATDAGVRYRGVITWTRFHGFASLEIEGAFASIGIDPDAVYRREVDALGGQ